MKVQYDTLFGRQDTVRRDRHGMPWTEPELHRLRNHFNNRHPLEQICEAMQRPAAGVIGKLAYLRLIEFDSGDCKYYCQQSPAPRPQSKPTKEPIMALKNIETQVLIRGANAAGMTDPEIFKFIADLENDVVNLEAIKAKSVKLEAAKSSLHTDIAKLVDYVDARP